MIGNKVDLEQFREVEYAEGTNLSNTLNYQYAETSALKGDNVDELFHQMI